MPWNINLRDTNWLNPWAGAANVSQPKTGQKRPRSDDNSPAPKRQSKGPEKEKGFHVAELFRQPKASQIAKRDRELTEEAPMRWKPDISPGDDAFTEILDFFKTLLDSDTMTFDKILNTIFSPQERQLLIPANRQLRPALADIQKQNRETYLALLGSRRFKAWTSKHEPNLAFKLTLAFFGIPVEPISADTLYQIRDGMSDDGDEELSSIMPAKRNLRFANKYNTRMYGRDALRKPDRMLETYYAFDELQAGPSYSRFDNLEENLSAPMGLRGGGGSDDNDDYHYEESEEEDDDNDDDEWKPSAGRKAKGNMLQGQEAGDVKDVQIPLYGYQGKVWFRADKFTTFVDAVDRLLGLGNRAGVTYTLRIRDKTKKLDPWKKKTISCRGVGDFSADGELWEWATEQLASKPLSDRILFVSGPSDTAPARWEPTDEDRVLKLSLEWQETPEWNRPDVAYIRMPQKSSASNMRWTNQYGPWMVQACRVLAAGQIPERPGQPEVPDAFFSLKDTSGQGPDLGTYGGLAFLPQLWEKMVESWKTNAKKTVVLNAIGAPWLSDRFFMFIPGNGAAYDHSHYILHAPLDEEDGSPDYVGATILRFVQRSMTKANYSKLDVIEVHLPGDGLLVPSNQMSDLVIPVSTAAQSKKPLDGAVKDVTERLLMWKRWLGGKKAFFPATNGLHMFPQFLSLRPIFSVNTIRAKNNGSMVGWEPSTYTLQQFRAAVEELCTGKRSKSGGATSYITVKQGVDMTGRLQKVFESKPSLLITPQTDEEAWLCLRNFIVEPEVVVSISRSEEKPVILGSLDEQPFGYREIYKDTPFNELYKGLKENEYPKGLHHYDFQMYAENPSPSAKLKTIQPRKIASPDAIFRNPTTKKPTPKPANPPPIKNLKGNPPKKPKQVRFTDARSYRPIADVKVTLIDPKPQFMNDKTSTDLQKALKMREYSYDHPLNVHMFNTIPIHAPPVDKILRVGGTNTPLVSQAMLTPSETRWYQRGYFNLRNILLNRNQACPFPECEQIYPTAEPEQLEKHLKDMHTVTAIRENCPFCETKSFHLWNKDQRVGHFVTDHADILADKFPGASKPKPFTTTYVSPEGEDQWKFCARCGRDHKQLSRVIDRRQHDKVCYRGAAQDYEDDQLPRWEVCSGCGDRFAEGKDEEHNLSHKPGKHTYRPYCVQCGLPLGKCIKNYQDKHSGGCNGYGKEDLAYCPWCGGGLLGGVEERLGHTDECEERPEGAEDVFPPVVVGDGGGENEGEELEEEDGGAEIVEVTTRISKKRNTDEEGDEGGRNVSFMEKPEVRVIPPVEEEEEGTTTKKTGRKKRKTGCI